jgi:hypothetical protein
VNNNTSIQQSGPIKPISESRPDDLFLACASYEPRSTSVVSQLDTNYQTRFGRVYVNKEFTSGSAGLRLNANLGTIKSKLSGSVSEVEVHLGSWLDPILQLEALLLATRIDDSTHDSPVQHITIDVTTFNREALLCAIAIIRENYPLAVVRTLYVSPDKHGDWLSRGYRLVRSIVGFPGVQQPALPTALVVLSGFEPDRTQKIVEEYEPSKLLLGIGDPPTEPSFLTRNLHDQSLMLARQDVEQFKFPANDMLACLSKLQSIVSELKDQYNIVLAPMSTKLSTLGAYLVAECNRDIQIAYCVPGEYNIDDYSSGTGRRYEQTLPPIAEA